MVHSKGKYIGQANTETHGEEHPFPGVRFTLDNSQGCYTRHVEQAEDHERQSYGRVKVFVVSQVGNEAGFVRVIGFYAVNRSQCGDHDFLSSRAGYEANTDLPIITERCNDRFDKVAEAGSIALGEFFRILLFIESSRCVVCFDFGIKERQSLGIERRV